jgi:polysaccharide export outer membrane protein
MVPLILVSCTNNSGANNGPVAGVQMGAAEQSTAEPSAEAGQSPEQSESATALASVEPKGGDYRIAPYDAVQVAVFQVQDLNKTVEVAADGTISLPLIGKVPVAGKTTREIETVIGDRLRKKYLQSPDVSVTVAKYGQRVTVSGAVRNPQVLAVDAQLSLSEVVARAGGLSDVGNGNRVHIARREGDRVRDAVYNLNSIQAGSGDDPLIKGGDIVVAEENGVKVVLNSVKDLLPFAIFSTLF